MTDLQVHRCTTHGDFEIPRLDGPFAHRIAKVIERAQFGGCPKCAAAHRAAESQAEEALKRQHRRERRHASCGLIGRYREASFDTFRAATKKQLDVLTACQEYADTIDTGTWSPLWLIGPCGVGKTHLMAAMVRHVIDSRDIGAGYTSSRGMIRQLRDTWAPDAKELHSDVLHSFSTAPLLAIDEMGIGFGTDAELTQLLDVLDARYSLCLPTVIASNLTVDGLRAALGDRIFDRLKEGARVLSMTWESHRGSGK